MYGDIARARIISDLSVVGPAAALSRRGMPGHWRVIDYETEAFAGRLLFAGEVTQAPPVHLPLDASGWYAIYIGFWCPCWSSSIYELRLKLNRDANYVHWNPESDAWSYGFTPDNPERLERFLERFWKYAELSHDDVLTIAQQSRGVGHPAGIGYIKLVPLSPTEVHAIQADRARGENRRLIAMNDAYSDFCTHRPATSADIEEWIEPYRHSDVGKLFWCMGGGGDVVTYDSRLGQLAGQDVADFPLPMDRHLAESLYGLLGEGIDPLRVACDYAHSLGIEFHVSQRMGAFGTPPPWDEEMTGRLYREHPEWRCVDRDGTPIARMSYAFAGVRRLIIDMFREVCAYGIDGIDLVFNRSAPFLLYEAPLIEGFQALYGEDARLLPEDDGRWLRYRAGAMTAFMRQLRAEMDECGPTPAGRRLQISAHVLHDATHNHFYGLALEDWVAGGLVDRIIPYPWKTNDSNKIELAYFAQLCAGSSVEWAMELMPRQMEPAAYLELAKRYYAAGADGLCMWDTNGRDRLWRQWAIASRLGHREELDALDPADAGAALRPIRTVGGYRTDRHSAYWAY
jgi:hypothetical protein